MHGIYIYLYIQQKMTENILKIYFCDLYNRHIYLPINRHFEYIIRKYPPVGGGGHTEDIVCVYNKNGLQDSRACITHTKIILSNNHLLCLLVILCINFDRYQ